MDISARESGAVAQVDEALDSFKTGLVRDLSGFDRPWASSSAIIGRIIAILPHESGPRIHCALLGNEPIPARSTIALHRGHLGCEAVLMLENGNPQLPIVVGVLQEGTLLPAAPDQEHLCLEDGRVLLQAQEELVLRCGAATISLRSDGTVTVRGTRVVSEADGSMRIRGASIQLN